MSTPVSKMKKQELIEEASRLGYVDPHTHTVDELRNIVTDLQGSAEQSAAEAREHLESKRAEFEELAAVEPKPLDISVLRDRRRYRTEGVPFTLTATTDGEGNPTVVRVRIPDILDADTLDMLPDALRAEVFSTIEEVEKANTAAMRNVKQGGEGEAVTAMSTAELASRFGNLSKMADAYVIAGFIEPRVYATPEEADEHGGAWVKDIEFVDRMAFFTYCTDNERGAASLAKPFPAR